MGEPRRAARLLAAAGARAGTVRVRLTIAVTLLFAAALSIGSTVLVRSVEHTVLRTVETADREQLDQLRSQIEGGVPLSALQLAPPRATYFEIRQADEEAVRQAADEELAEPPPHAFGPPLSCEMPPPHGFGVLGGRPMPGRARFAGGPPRSSFQAMDSPVLPGDVPPGPHILRRHPSDWSLVEVPSVSSPVGPLRLLAASPVDDVRRSAETLRRVLWVATPLLLALIAAVAWFITGRALSPVLAMTRQVGRITTATLHERLPEPGTRDEIAALAQTLNGMLARLGEAVRRQREFVSDASHELRSPIASLRAQLEVALAHPQRADWPAVAESALAEGLRLEALVADLLLLARLDEGAALPQGEVDLDDVVRAEVRRPRRLAVDASRVGAGRVRGDAGHLTRVARNLLDNAARHARGRVEVSLVGDGNQVVLAVDDDGPGVPEAERERIFERFTRLEEARSRDAGGVGLGLALVRRIVERHGGTARVVESPLGGARAEVRLPAAAINA
jgi:signal transduction histidine kinase